jgi:glutaredoxin 3
VIPSPRVQLYTTSFCALCARARQLLERAGVIFEEIDLSSVPERCCELEALTGGRSAPQLAVDGRPIGGFDELAALQRNGLLAGWTSADSTSTPSLDL